MKMLISSPAPVAGAASRSRSASVARISRNVRPASRSFSTTATWATASAARRSGISTKIVRITPLFSVSTRSSRSEETWISSSRSSTAFSSDGPTATPSSRVRTPNTWAARYSS